MSFTCGMCYLSFLWCSWYSLLLWLFSLSGKQGNLKWNISIKHILKSVMSQNIFWQSSVYFFVSFFMNLPNVLSKWLTCYIFGPLVDHVLNWGTPIALKSLPLFSLFSLCTGYRLHFLARNHFCLKIWSLGLCHRIFFSFFFFLF